MEGLVAVFAILWMLFIVVVGLVSFAAWLHGLILAFRASIIFGIICFLVHVPFVVFGVVYWITGIDLAKEIVDWFRDNV